MQKYLVLLVLVSTPLLFGAVIDTRFESFEGNIPNYITTSRQNMIAFSSEHYKEGSQSLRWDWWPGDSLQIRHGIGDINHVGGYAGNYSKATFGVWVYCEKPQIGALLFQFRTGNRVNGYFSFPLNFKGWRRANLRYTYYSQFKGKITSAVDNILILAPDSNPGTCFIDLLVYNGLMDYRQQYLPVAETWHPHYPEPEQFPLPDSVSAADLDGIRKIDIAFKSAPIQIPNDNTIAELKKRVAAFNIKVHPGGFTTGQPLAGVPLFTPLSIYTDNGIDSLQTPDHITDLMFDLAKSHAAAITPALKKQLVDWYLLLVRHLADQGYVAGSGNYWNWYRGSKLAEATFMMRDVLRNSEMQAASFDFFDYNYNGSIIFDPASHNPSMDTFHLDSRYRLYYALLQPDNRSIVRALLALSRYISTDILFAGNDGFKIDGATFHHQGHYFGYARYAMTSLSLIVQALSNTPFAISPAAYDRLKQAALKMRFYCHHKEAPLSLQGRNLFDPSNAIQPILFYRLAMAAGPQPDPELAAAYLRFVGTSSPQAEELQRLGFRPEPDPQGNLTINYGAFSVHRRDHWMAIAKGSSRYVWGQEIYQNRNRFGRYLSNGSLFIHQGGKNTTVSSSGYVEPGWDWNMLDGATVIRLPLDQLRATAGTEMLKTTKTFVGGLSHRALQGIFTTVVEGAKQHSPGFTARKSFFFADDLIFCLGSDIRTADKDHEALTCLFQSAFTPGKSRLTVDSRVIASLPSAGQTGPDAGWLLSPSGTGIVLPPGVRANFRLARQSSRNHQDSKDTIGDFATAWISHGRMPQSAAYQYLVVPAATPTRLEQLAAELKDPALSPVKVLKQDSRCHAVTFPRLGLWSAAFFAPQPTPFMPGLQAVSRPCLVIIEKGRDDLLVSWADPDLRLKPEGCHGQVSVPADTELTFSGSWEPVTSEKTVKLVSRNADTTVIRLTGKDGLGVEFRLKPLNVIIER